MQNGVGTELWRASDGGVTAQPSISPDGKQIALSVLKNGRARLYVTNTDGADRRALADSLATRDSPSWSPDGRVLAVAGYDDKGSGLFLVPVDGGVPIRLYDKVSYLPVWSPDGRYIVFAEYIQGTMMQLRAITPEGKPFPIPDVRLTRTGSRGAMSSPCFTPDGKSLVLLDGEWRKPQFWVVDLQSGRRRQLTELRPGRWSHGFDVSRDGKSILFDRVAENSHVVLIELANRQ
jgi:Tol biopolymer transport system component